jgi:hypothetical protein
VASRRSEPPLVYQSLGEGRSGRLATSSHTPIMCYLEGRAAEWSDEYGWSERVVSGDPVAQHRHTRAVQLADEAAQLEISGRVALQVQVSACRFGAGAIFETMITSSCRTPVSVQRTKGQSVPPTLKTECIRSLRIGLTLWTDAISRLPFSRSNPGITRIRTGTSGFGEAQLRKRGIRGCAVMRYVASCRSSLRPTGIDGA